MKKGIGPKKLGSPLKQDIVKLKKLDLHKQVLNQPKVRDIDIYQIGDPMKGAELTDPSISDKQKLLRSKRELHSHRMKSKFEKPDPGFENVPVEGKHALDKISIADIEAGNFPASSYRKPISSSTSKPSIRRHKKDVRQAKVYQFFQKFKKGKNK
jgi:hypothetical protein